NHVAQVRDKNLAVANLAGLSGPHDRIDDEREVRVGANDIHLHLGNEIDGILRAAIHLGMSLLAAKAADFRDGHPMNAALSESIFYIFELEMPNDRFDFLHRCWLQDPDYGLAGTKLGPGVF